MVLQSIDGINYRLRSPYDMSFLSKYGQVFRVFDDQDSGNICFGTEDGQKRYFVKFAGAPTAEYRGSKADAIAWLTRAAVIYRDLAHRNLIRYLWSEEIGGGFAVVFEWTDAVCMGKQYPEQRARFLTIPDGERLKIFDDILDFHACAANCGYVAVDFYDGCIMYDFDTKQTVICDIDFYRKGPVINDRGRMWGSSRFMSPEEFTLGAEIDEITNVYCMGATAFALFGGETDRSLEQWRLPEPLYRVAEKAASAERSERYPGIGAMITAWNQARKG